MKTISFMVSACLFAVGLNAHQSGYEGILAEIEQNNLQLQAYAAASKAQGLEDQLLQSGGIMDLQALYLPFGDKTAPGYLEVQFSQQFAAPGLYRARRGHIGQLGIAREAAYSLRRQEVLAAAAELCTRLVYLGRKEAAVRERVGRAGTLLERIREMYELEEIGRPAFNKARLDYLREQFSLEKVAEEQAQLMEELRGLNGDQPLFVDSMTFAAYGGSLALPSVDSLWQDRLGADPLWSLRRAEESTALSRVAVAGKERLPQWSVGWNFQGFPGNNSTGPTAGLSMPAWGSRTARRAAEAAHIHEQAETAALEAAGKAVFKARYINYSTMLSRYGEYDRALAELDSEALLLQAFDLGHYSYMDYYQELLFYRAAKDELLRMEYELHLLKNQLLKHRL